MRRSVLEEKEKREFLPRVAGWVRVLGLRAGEKHLSLGHTVLRCRADEMMMSRNCWLPEHFAKRMRSRLETQQLGIYHHRDRN